MDCFKIKLLLRNSYHSHTQDYSPDVFEHLFMCRSCWAYANYLWHREGQEIGRKHQFDEASREARLDAAWAARGSLRPGGPTAAATPHDDTPRTAVSWRDKLPH